MEKIIKKFFLFSLVFVVWLSFDLMVKAEGEDISLIMTNPGEDCSTQMNITWHAKTTGSYVQYTTKDDESFNNKKTVIPKETLLEIYDGTSGSNVTDYKCSVTLTDLQPNTDYIYRVMLNSASQIHHFKTAGSTDFSFAVVSDIHTYSKLPTRLSKANSIVHKMENETPLNFILAVGDIMAYGTNRGYWDDFTKSDFALNYMISATPGNHDYYNSSANFLDSSYFNAYTNNPANGCEQSFNTTYYFYYGNVLFVSLNSEDACTNASARSSQREWFDNVLRENEKAMYKIVYFHRSMYPGSGSNTGHASTMKGAFQDLLDKYGVDLVFGGHDHVYVRTNKILNGKESSDSSFGTTYISLPQIGDRASAAGSDMTGIAKKIGSFSGAVLVSVSEGSMRISLYDDNGTILDSANITNKMSSISKNKVNNNTKITYDKDFSNMILSIPDILFQRAYNVKVIDKSTNKEVLSIRPSYGVTEYKINGVSNYAKEKEYDVIISYRNDTQFTKTITVKNNLDYGTLENLRIEGNTLKWDANLDGDIIEELRVIEKDKETSLDISTISYSITSSPFDKQEIKLQLIAIDGAIADEFTLPYGISTEDIIFAVPEITVLKNDEITIEIVNSLDIDISFTYEYDEAYIKEDNGKLYAIKEGETVVICKNESFDDLIVKVSILPPQMYRVTFDANGGECFLSYEDVETIMDLTNLKTGRKPTKKGYDFTGYYLDKECTIPLDIYNYQLTSDSTLYVGWEKVGGCNNAAAVINLIISLFTSFSMLMIIKKKH